MKLEWCSVWFQMSCGLGMLKNSVYFGVYLFPILTFSTVTRSHLDSFHLLYPFIFHFWSSLLSWTMSANKLTFQFINLDIIDSSSASSPERLHMLLTASGEQVCFCPALSMSVSNSREPSHISVFSATVLRRELHLSWVCSRVLCSHTITKHIYTITARQT